MTLKSFLLFLVLAVLFSGCVKQPGLYYWGDYSNSLYAWRKDATGEKAAAHRAELKIVIERSSTKGMRVPPGVYCEYGYMLFLDGDQEEAVTFFQKEAEEYPESGKFVSFLMARLEDPDNEEDSDDAQTD